MTGPSLFKRKAADPEKALRQDGVRARICLIHKVRVPDPRSFYKEGRSLARAGFAVTIIGLFEQDETIDGVRMIGFKPPAGRLLGFLVTNWRIFRRALQMKADVYHFHNLDFVPWAVLLKVMSRAAVVYDIHEAFPEYMLLKTYLPKPVRKMVSVLIYLMEHGASKFFDAIIPNDNYVARGFKHPRNVVIYNFPTLDFFKDAAPIPFDLRRFDLFYHGSLPKYHVEIIMRIAEKLNSERVPNTWGLVTNDKETIAWATGEFRRRKLDRNFVFLDYTDYLNVFEYLRSVRIGIIPLPPYKKFMKNIPLKMFEFMGCGIPIVLSDLPPSRQFIQGEGCAVAVEPDNVEEYARAISHLLKNSREAEGMGRNGMRLVFEKYNWGSEEAKLFRLYDHLTGGGAA